MPPPLLFILSSFTIFFLPLSSFVILVFVVAGEMLSMTVSILCVTFCHSNTNSYDLNSAHMWHKTLL